MKTIMLVCSAGMSTSLLVTKMEKAAAEKGLEAKIFAVAEAEASRV
ncbi:phosphotransferase system, lactose/cellobiose-specific IIB subunit, partial [Listeria innocua FSL S4-378]